MKIIDPEKLICAICESIKITEGFEQDVQQVLDEKYKHFGLQAINTYLRPRIHPQMTVCVFKNEDWDDARPDKIIFAIHVNEFKYNSVEKLVEERINISKWNIV